MAVKIRLARHGAKKRPFYRIVVADIEKPRDGRFLENVGTYNPLLDPPELSFKDERIRHWLDQGAIPTNTVKNLFKTQDFYKEFAQQQSAQQVQKSKNRAEKRKAAAAS